MSIRRAADLIADLDGRADAAPAAGPDPCGTRAVTTHTTGTVDATGTAADRDGGNGEVRVLPAASLPRVSPGQAVAGRRAVRSFSDAPLAQEDLHAVLAAMERAGERWRESRERGIGARPVVLAMRVAGLPFGFYRYASGGTLHRVGGLRSPEQVAPSIIQPEFTRAGALLMPSVDFGKALDAQGTHGYRLLLGRTGAMVQAAWLAAEQRGLGGCAFPGVLHGTLRRHTDLDGFRHSAFLSFAVGHPRQDAPGIPG